MNSYLFQLKCYVQLDLNAYSTAATVYYKIAQRVAMYIVLDIAMYIVLDVRLSIPVRLQAWFKSRIQV